MSSPPLPQHPHFGDKLVGISVLMFFAAGNGLFSFSFTTPPKDTHKNRYAKRREQEHHDKKIYHHSGPVCQPAKHAKRKTAIHKRKRQPQQTNLFASGLARQPSRAPLRRYRPFITASSTKNTPFKRPHMNSLGSTSCQNDTKANTTNTFHRLLGLEPPRGTYM